MPYRVVRSPGATAHRHRQVPVSRQTESPDRAAITGQAALRPGRFDTGPGVDTSSGTVSFGGGSIDNFLAGLGFSIPPAPVTNQYGVPVSPFYNPWSPGARLGAFANMTPWGAGVAAQFGASSDPLRSFGSSPFGVGGRFYGRGTGQWASSGNDQNVQGAEAALSKDLDALHSAEERLNGVIIHYANVIAQHGKLTPAEAYAMNHELEFAGRWVKFYSNEVKADRGAVWWAKNGAAVKRAGGAAGRAIMFFLGAGDPNPDWVISPALGQGAEASSSGQYPTGFRQPRGALSPMEAARTMRRLSYSAQHEGWWGGQWVHLNEGPGSGAGGHGPAAPASAVLGGRKHAYDWVAAGGQLR